jgi:S-adenosyl methyltransferase
MGTGFGGSEQKPATAARIYDYVLGGVHNFPADRAAAEQAIAQFPLIPPRARANRALLRRMVHYLSGVGVRQFLDIGSGMPTAGNVHEIAQAIAPQTRVVYVDLDPVAVAESQELLDGNHRAAAIHGDARSPQAILEHPQVRKLLDFDRPIGVLLVALLHFVPDDEVANDAVRQFVAAVAPGSYLAISHTSAEGFELGSTGPNSVKIGQDIYRRQTATPITLRTRDQVARFFEGTELVDPGLVWMTQWRPAPGDPDDFADDPARSGQWAAIGRIG